MTPPSDSQSLLENVVGRFERAWRSGKRPDLDAFLRDSAGELPPDVLVELVHADLEMRLKNGEAARVEEYLQRYPRLKAPEVVLALITTEYRQRRRVEPTLSFADYASRFPELAHRLTEPAVSSDGGIPDTIPDGFTPPKTAAGADPVAAPPGYELLGVLGQGGMGIVYRARQVQLGRIVALKMIRGGGTDDAELTRFRLEAEALARLQHPNIVQIFEVGSHQGRPFCALEFVPGGSLDRRLRETTLPPRAAAELVETLARAMHAAHQAGVVHRDLKPGNVLLLHTAPDLDGPKVTDFGLAKRLDDESGHTRTGQLLGTPSYMAPEQADGRAVDARADTYALGAILYECLTGRPPFRGATVLDTLEQVRSREPVPPQQLQPGIPRDLETVCLKCLQKEPGKRYESAEALADDLRRWLDGRPILARRAGPVERAAKWARRNPALTVAGALLVALAVVSVVFAVTKSRDADELRRAAGDLDQKNRELDTTNGELRQTNVKLDTTNGDLRQTNVKLGLETDAKKLALTESERQRERAARLAYAQGLAFCEQGEAGRGLLWFVRALELAPEAATELRRSLRLQLAAWETEVPRLRACLAYNPMYLIKKMQFDPDGRSLLVVQPGEGARLWDLTGAEPRARLLDRDASDAAFTEDGKQVATVSAGRYQLWDSASGAKRETQPTGTVLALLPNGRPVEKPAAFDKGRLLAASATNNLLFVEVVAGTPLRSSYQLLDTLAGGKVLATLPLTSFAPEAQFVATDRLLVVNLEGAQFWNTQRGSPDFGKPVAPPFTGKETGPIHHVVLGGLGSGSVVTAARDVLQVWGASAQQGTAARYGTPVFQGGPVEEVVFSNTSGTLFAASSGPGWMATSGQVRLWRIVPGHQGSVPVGTDAVRPVGAPLAHPGVPQVLTAAVDHGLLATTVNTVTERTLRLWETPAATVGDPFAFGPPVGVTPDGRRLLVASHALPFQLRVVDTETGKDIKKIDLPPARGGALRLGTFFSPDGRTVFAGKDRWQLDAEKGVADGPLGPDENYVAVSGDGRLVAIRPQTRPFRVLVREVESGQPVGQPVVVEQQPLAVAFHPDGKRLLVATAKGLQLWDSGTGKAASELWPNLGGPYLVRFAPDGNSFWVAENDGRVRRRDATTGRQIGPSLVHRTKVERLVFSPDEHLLATASWDGTARLWDAATGEPVGPFLPHEGPVLALAFTADGKRLVTANNFATDGVAHRWPVPQPLEGSADRLKTWAEWRANMELTEAGEFRVLTGAEWRDREAAARH